jgi:glyoxylase-like metal-dependent hydrolase (beta-lactamase superfamily II)
VKGKGIQNLIKASEAIAKLGLSAADITDVVITHMHWDHADGMDLFPKAKIWIQKEEYAYYTGAAWQAGGKHGGIEPEDVLTIVKLNTQNQVNLVDGDDREIIDGIRVYTGGRHTFASQYVGVRTARGTAIIASDNMYLYENLEKHAPIAQTFDADSNLKGSGAHEADRLTSRPDCSRSRSFGVCKVSQAWKWRGADSVIRHIDRIYMIYKIQISCGSVLLLIM